MVGWRGGGREREEGREGGLSAFSDSGGWVGLGWRVVPFLFGLFGGPPCLFDASIE